MTRPLVVPPGEGHAVDNPLGGHLTFKSTAAESGGALTAVEAVAAVGEGPPLHVHPERDELIYTLDGTVRVQLGEELVQAPSGTFVFIPRGTHHTWQNAGDAPARLLATVMPADAAFERLFLSYAELAPDERGPEAFARLARETGAIQVVGPPLG